MLQHDSPVLQQTPRRCHPDSCARNRPPDAARLLAAQKTDTQLPALHRGSKTFALLPKQSLSSSLTFHNATGLALLERERLRILGIRKLHAQRHRVAFDLA